MNFLLFQCLFIPRERRRTNAARSLSPRCAHGSRNPAPRSANQHLEPRRSRVRRHHFQSHEIRLHGRQGVRQSLGHLSAESEDTS